MKRVTLFFSALLATVGLSAQTFVSTSPSNRNVVLEEYTGIYCTFCPDGHKRAQALKTANPGRVVLINIHTGGYANPNGTDPDFRTTYGDGVAGHSNVKIAGYPAGSTNRRIFPNSQNGGTASSRGNWATDAATVLGEPSVVNVDARASYDGVKKEVSITVEAYYTGNGTASNNLNVGILQNNVPGPQTGGATYFPAMVLPNGQYNHQHMLRASLTGQWGDVITTTSKGSFISRTYTWTVPANLKGVPVQVNDLEVYAFISDGQQTTLTGSVIPVQLPSSMRTDLSMVSGSTTPNDMCTYTLTPEVTVTNVLTNSVTSFNVSYALTGTSGGNRSYSGNLGNNQSTTLTFPQTAAAPGASKLSYGGPSNINNGQLIDINNANNSLPAEYIYTVAANPSGSSFKVDFEGLTSGTETPANAFLMNENSERVFVVTRNVTNPPLSQQLGGFGQSQASYRFDIPTWTAGNEVSMYFNKVDMSAAGSLDLEFDVAYANWDGNSDAELEVSASTDCGKTWISLYKKSGSNLATASDLAGQRFYPQTTEWRKESVKADAVAGSNQVILMVTGRMGVSGNAMYLDNFELIPGTGPDTIPPSTPAVLSASNIDKTSVDISWTAATDNIGVKDYDLYQDGNLLTTTSNLMEPVSGLSPATTYDFYVVARDSAGNLSAPSVTLKVTTKNNNGSGGGSSGGGGVVDSIPPTSPTNLAASMIEKTSVQLDWDASLDNVQVTEYEVYKDGLYYATTPNVSQQVIGLTPAQSYVFFVRAKDAAGNTSSVSNVITVTTKKNDGTGGSSQPGGDTNALSIEQQIIQKIGMEVYPNPAQEKAYVSLTVEQGNELQIKLYNLTGQEVHHQVISGLNAGRNEIEIPVHSLESGMYQLEVITQDGTVTQKIMVE